MGKEVVFEVNSAGIIEMLQSSGAGTVCGNVARQVLSSAGDGFILDTRISGDRVAARVKVDSKEGYKKCMQDNVLLKALGGAQV